MRTIVYSFVLSLLLAQAGPLVSASAEGNKVYLPTLFAEENCTDYLHDGSFESSPLFTEEDRQGWLGTCFAHYPDRSFRGRLSILFPVSCDGHILQYPQRDLPSLGRISSAVFSYAVLFVAPFEGDKRNLQSFYRADGDVQVLETLDRKSALPEDKWIQRSIDITSVLRNTPIGSDGYHIGFRSNGWRQNWGSSAFLIDDARLRVCWR